MTEWEKNLPRSGPSLGTGTKEVGKFYVGDVSSLAMTLSVEK